MTYLPLRLSIPEPEPDYEPPATYYAYIEGQEARLAGEPALSNPYDESNVPCRDEWIRGWMVVDHDLRNG